MAESRQTTGAVHLTKLDLDISGITASLNTAKEQIENFSNEIPRTVSTSLDSAGQETLLKKLGITQENIEQAKNQLESLAKEIEKIGDYQSVSVSSKGGELFKAIVTYADEAGKSIQKTIDLTKILSEGISGASTTKVTDNYAKQVEAQNKQAIQSLRRFYKEYEDELKREAQVEKETYRAIDQRNAALEKEEQQLRKLSQAEKDFLEETERSQQNAVNSLNSLEKGYESLAKSIQNSTLGDSSKTYFLKVIEDARVEIEKLKSDLSEGFGIPEGTEKRISAIGTVLEKITSSFHETQKAAIETAKEFNSISTGIEKAVKQLDILETKAGIFGDSKQRVANLREEYQKLAEQIKNGSISVDDAKAKFDQLGAEFDQLSLKIKNGDGTLNKFLTTLADKAKWYAAFQVMNLLQQAFGNVINTIKDTEDAVIEIQRVLNDPSLADSTVSQRIYDIAYEYGQTFENVQEVFTRFAQAGLDFEQATKATEAAMLGLNTAELDVSTATQGLIAIMAQFGYTADDLTMIIDKINITADNFAVTSEKIVAGLQRAGGTANAFGLTLEETIGIITALSEATGRSGEQIGTALNSLISFTEKASSLSKFSDFLGVDASQMGVLDLWRSLSAVIKDGDNSLAQMLSTSEEFNDLFTEEIASAIGATEEFNKAQLEAKDVYGTVGTYRQNYFIALLNNIDTAIEAIENMDGALGYSRQENEKAMSRLTAQWNQLVVAAKELAVQFGEVGFLDLLKWIANASTSILKLLKDIGGLRTALIALASALAAVKAQKIADYFSKVVHSQSNLVAAVRFATSSFKNFKLSISGIATSLKEWATSASGVVTIVGAISSAISIAISVYNNWKQKQEEMAAAAYEAAKASSDQAAGIAEVITAYRQSENAYKQGKTSKDNLNSATDALITKLKEEGIIVGELSGDYEELKEKIDDVLESVSDEQLSKASEAADKAKDKFIEAFNEQITGSGMLSVKVEVDGEIDKDLVDILNRIDGLDTDKRQTARSGRGGRSRVSSVYLYLEDEIESVDDAIEAYESLIEARKAITEYYGPKRAGETDLYQQLSALIDVLKKAKDEYEDYDRKLKDIEDAYNGVIPKTDDSAKSNNELTATIHDLDEAIDALSSQYDTFAGKLSGLQSAYGTLISAVDEYNDTGIMTQEMLESLLELEPEYIALLEVRHGKLSLNKEGVDALVASTDTYMQQMVALKIAEEAETLAKELQTAATNQYTLEQFKAQAATAAFKNELFQAVLNMIQGKGSADDLARALEGVAASAQLSGEWLEYFNGQFKSIFDGYSALLSLPKSFTLPASSYKPASVSTGSGGSGGSSAANDAKKALQDEIKAYQDREKEIKDYYAELKKTTQDYYDGLIDELKAVQEENSRINAQLDYYNSRQKIITNLEQAQARSGVEWREKEMEYQQQLIDLDEDWRRKQEDWSLEDRIAELGNLKEIAVKQIEEATDAAVAEIEKVIATLQEEVSKLSSSTASSLSGAISSGVSSGVSFAETVMNGLSSSWKNTINEMFMNTQKQVSEARPFNNLVEQIKNVGNTTKSVFGDALSKYLPDIVKESASAMYKIYKDNLISPVQSLMQNVMSQMRQAFSSISGLFMGSAINTGSTSSGYNTSTNVNMYNNINSTSTANSVVNSLFSRLNSFR